MNEESRVFLAELQKNLTDYFSLEEIETLAFIMGVDYDSLRGATKPTKVNSLIMALSRQGQIELQVEHLTADLVEETRRRESAEQQTGEVEKRRTELEVQLKHLQEQLEAAHKQLAQQQESSGSEQARLAARSQELEAAQTQLEQRLKRLTESLAGEIDLRKERWKS